MTNEVKTIKRKSTFFTSGLKMLLRQETLFRLIREECGSIEPGKFFVSLPGQCGVHDTPLMGSELFHLVRAGLLTEAQYVGIEQEQSVFKANKRVAPAAKWHLGTFSMLIEFVLKTYRTQVLHFDTCSTHTKNLNDLLKTLALVNSLYPSDKFVICYNGVSSYRQWKSKLEKDVKKNALFEQLIADGNWEVKDTIDYTSSNTKMSVMPLVKRGVTVKADSIPLEDSIDDKETQANQGTT